MSGFITNAFLSYKLIELLSTDFKKWEAYDLGIIDENGKLLKKPLSKEERDSYSMFHKIIRKLKVIMNKFIGPSRLSAMLATLYLVKESAGTDIVNTLINELKKIDADFGKYLNKPLLEHLYFESDANQLLYAGKYFVLFPDNEYVFIIEEDLKPCDIFCKYPVYKIDDMFFMKDQIRRFIAKKGD